MTRVIGQQMNFDTDEYFGTDAQQALLRRGAAMYAALRDDPRYGYYGRIVGLFSPDQGPAGLLRALCHLQGASHYSRTPDAELPALRARFEAQGLCTTTYARWHGGAAALAAARHILDTTPLPDDLTVLRLGPDTSREDAAKLGAVALDCGVLPPAGSVLRGMTIPGLGLVALDRAGRPVACAGAAAYTHRDFADPHCWWGMLATRPERRGERLALVLGAMAILDMRERYGFRSFYTGVQPGNAASEAVCTRMGLHHDGFSIINVVDPAQLPGGRLTR